MSEDVSTPSRRITYLIPAPGVPHWVSVTFSTVGDGDPASEFTEVLIGLFDAIMTTFRWTEAAAPAALTTREGRGFCTPPRRWVELSAVPGAIRVLFRAF